MFIRLLRRQPEHVASLYSLRTHRQLSLAEISGTVSEDWNMFCKMAHPSIFREILIKIQLIINKVHCDVNRPFEPATIWSSTWHIYVEPNYDELSYQSGSTVTRNSPFFPAVVETISQYSMRLTMNGSSGWAGIPTAYPRAVTHPSSNRTQRIRYDTRV